MDVDEVINPRKICYQSTHSHQSEGENHSKNCRNFGVQVQFSTFDGSE